MTSKANGSSTPEVPRSMKKLNALTSSMRQSMMEDDTTNNNSTSSRKSTPNTTSTSSSMPSASSTSTTSAPIPLLSSSAVSTRRDYAMQSTRDIPAGNLQELYTDLLEKYKRVVQEKEEMGAMAERRQEAYLRKEIKYREELGAMEERIQSISSDDPASDLRMKTIRNMHTNIQDTIGQIQNKTSRILQDQERDLIRAFRARLADVTDELDKERKKNESGSVEWVQRCRKLTEELEWLRDLTDKLTAENKNVLKENRRFKRQMKTQEEDREFLIKQLVAVKRENARLRYTIEQSNLGSSDLSSPSQNKQRLRGISPLPSTLPNSTSHMPAVTRFGGARSQLGSPDLVRPQTAAELSNRGSSTSPSFVFPSNAYQSQKLSTADDTRYQRIISKLKKQLESTQHQLRTTRTAYTHEITSRSELQSFLKRCIEDVRQDIAERRMKAVGGKGGKRVGSAGRLQRPATQAKPPLDPRTIPLSEFTSVDRINVMEWLLSQDQVIYTLFDKMFPNRMPTHETQLMAGTSDHSGGLSTAEFKTQELTPSPARSSTAPQPSRSSGYHDELLRNQQSIDEQLRGLVSEDDEDEEEHHETIQDRHHRAIQERIDAEMAKTENNESRKSLSEEKQQEEHEEDEEEAEEHGDDAKGDVDDDGEYESEEDVTVNNRSSLENAAPVAAAM